MKKIEMDYGMLQCPVCDSINLHQDTVAIYNCKEDENIGTHVEVDWDKVTMDNKMTDNPSPRRHGLSIHFWCEQCSENHPGSILNIYQHKGSTIMEWEDK